MTTIPVSPASFHISDKIASSVYEGLLSEPKWLPSWLFYDSAGSRLFDEITRIPEYYVTRTERAILRSAAAEIVIAGRRRRTRCDWWNWVPVRPTRRGCC